MLLPECGLIVKGDRGWLEMTKKRSENITITQLSILPLLSLLLQMSIDPSILKRILSESELEQLDASKTRQIATLWASYGSVSRLHFKDARPKTKILKLISPPNHSTSDSDHQSESDLRKRLSYRVESNFYRFYSGFLHPDCHVSRFYNSISSNPLSTDSDSHSTSASSLQALLLSDLVQDGFPKMMESRGLLNRDQTSVALRWLANFHACFFKFDKRQDVDCPPPFQALKEGWSGDGLWKIGGYSYLQTRLSEFNSISSSSEWSMLGPTSNLSFAVEHLLQSSKHQTIIHGDVKSANMAFSEKDDQVAFYDFQYVGRGLGVQDLSKFLTTSVEKDLLDDNGEVDLLKEYHEAFLKALIKRGNFEEVGVKDIYPFEQLLEDWKLAIVSWTRFQAGWGFWGNVGWIKKRTRSILKDEEWKEKVMKRWEEDGSPKE